MPTPQRYAIVRRCARLSLERFFSHIRFNTRTGCWLWRGALNSDGYGNFRLGRKEGHIGAHRFSFIHFRGRVPKGKELDHEVCETRHCANPFHVNPATHLENVRRAMR